MASSTKLVSMGSLLLLALLGGGSVQAPSSPQPDVQADNPVAADGPALKIALKLGNPPARKYHRPYVAVWIEDAKGTAVRMISIWGKEAKYYRELSRWWGFAQRDRKTVDAISRPSRPTGQYDLVWDLKDDRGKPLPPGEYTVRVESNREKGQHVNLSGKVDCGDKPASAKIDGNPEIEAVQLEYKPAKAKP